MRVAVSFEELIFNTATSQVSLFKFYFINLNVFVHTYFVLDVVCSFRVSGGLLEENILKDAEYGRGKRNQTRGVFKTA